MKQKRPSERITNDDICKKKKPLTLEYVDIDSIRPNDYNPNSHDTESFDLLLKSLDYFGFTQPIVVNKPTMQIIDGEHRFRAACVLGYSKVPVCFVEFDEVRMEYATIMHNQARGKWNQELMQKLLDNLSSSGSDYEKVLLLDRKKKIKK